jgi:Zn-dependent protease with chaperone function
LSPDEEDEIAMQLAGSGWYKAVGEILASEGSPTVIPTSDWRYQWVLDTLRRLEANIPVLSREPELVPNWMETGPDEHPLPPPAEYPLLPRPRASEYIHWVCGNITNQQADSAPRPAITISGPPYSLLVVDKPGSSNAFSYGFGANGGSGIVVYSGFLDDLFGKNPSPPPEEVQVKRSTLSRLFGGSFSNTEVPPHPKPTKEQTNELAILLAHEMAHLILSHHLESLSSFEVLVPGALSIFSDIVRVLIFPFTALLGPFVNDAVAQFGKVGSGELAKLSEYCTTKRQELEADIVSTR